MKNFLIILISIVSTIFSVKELDEHCDKEHFGPISGTIIGKSGQTVGSKYSIYTDYLMAIHPDNKNFSDFDLKVTFATFSKYKEGDHISFNHVNKENFDPSFKCYTDWIYALWLGASILMVILSLANSIIDD